MDGGFCWRQDIHWITDEASSQFFSTLGETSPLLPILLADCCMLLILRVRHCCLQLCDNIIFLWLWVRYSQSVVWNSILLYVCPFQEYLIPVLSYIRSPGRFMCMKIEESVKSLCRIRTYKQYFRWIEWSRILSEFFLQLF